MNFKPQAAGTHSQQRLILLVDDDLSILALLSLCLQSAGYETRMATSVQMALDIIGEGAREPDLAILDIVMPDMSGLELAKRLQEHTSIPFMFISASVDDTVVTQAAEYGAVGYLVKPIDTASIVPSTRAALARADEIRGLRETETKLTAALQAGRETGMAIGLLMERYKTDRNTAFEVLREYARSHRRKLNEVATELLLAEEALNKFMGRFNEQACRK